MNQEFTDSATLANQYAPGSCLFLHPSAGVEKYATASGVYVGARIQTEVLRLVWQVHYGLSHIQPPGSLLLPWLQ